MTLRALVDEIVVRAEAVEIHGDLPGRATPGVRKGIVPTPLMVGTIPSEARSRFVLTVNPRA